MLMHYWYKYVSYIYPPRHSVPGYTRLTIPLWRQFGMFAIRNSSTRKSQTVSAFIRICIHLFDLKRKVKISRLLRAFYHTEQTFVFKSFSLLNASGRSGRSVMMCVCGVSGGTSRLYLQAREIDTVTW